MNRRDRLGPSPTQDTTVPVYQHHRLVHIHIPKTGGTAIAQLFKQLGDVQWNPQGLYGERFSQNRWF